MYDKVSYNLEQLNQIYHEDVRLDKRGRMFLKKTRGFQECRNPDFTPITAMRNGERGKKTIQIVFNFPHWLPLREPNMSWVELAAETQRSPHLYWAKIAHWMSLELYQAASAIVKCGQMYQENST